MSLGFRIDSVNISKEKGTAKSPVDKATIRKGFGIEHDAHAGPWHRQVSLLSAEQIEAFDKAQRTINPGEFAENLTTRGIDLSQVAVLDRILIGSAVLEITQIGKECHLGCAIMQEVGACIMPQEGLFSRVLEGGVVEKGMTAVYEPRTLRISIVTLSDRASSGIYEDLSGPAIEQLLSEHFSSKRDHPAVSRILIPDEAERFEKELAAAVKNEADLVITTGSTGLGPRDIAPEVTTAFCDRLIPGIMEHARIKFGSKKPGALLSRGVAGISRSTVIVNFPGSVRAVKEYTTELLNVWEHLRRMIHGIDQH